MKMSSDTVYTTSCMECGAKLGVPLTHEPNLRLTLHQPLTEKYLKSPTQFKANRKTAYIYIILLSPKAMIMYNDYNSTDD